MSRIFLRIADILNIYIALDIDRNNNDPFFMLVIINYCKVPCQVYVSTQETNQTQYQTLRKKGSTCSMASPLGISHLPKFYFKCLVVLHKIFICGKCFRCIDLNHVHFNFAFSFSYLQYDVSVVSLLLNIYNESHYYCILLNSL